MTGRSVALPQLVNALSADSVRLVEDWAAQQAAELAWMRNELASMQAEAEDLESGSVDGATRPSHSLYAVIDAALASVMVTLDAAVEEAATAANATLAAAGRRAREELLAAGAGAEVLTKATPPLRVPALRRPRPAVELLQQQQPSGTSAAGDPVTEFWQAWR